MRHHRLTVFISKLNISMWKLTADADLIKLMFEFGSRDVINLVRENRLPAEQSTFELNINTRTHPGELCPFDISRISEPNGASFSVEVDPPAIGFKQEASHTHHKPTPNRSL